ncbi:MAG TPA: phenylacetate--CoA ligase family protein [Devosiaceae bacterium]|nr:phenylacetate--CoA ligase family protein [Devosiaceae bacterium]
MASAGLVPEPVPGENRDATDDAQYRHQLAYLFARSAFYRDKLGAAGLERPEDAGGLDAIAALPLTLKDELRQARTKEDALGPQLAAPRQRVVRIYSTSGTTGDPFYIPLTGNDLADWIAISMRSYAASGIAAGQSIVTTYGAGPFVAAVTLDAFQRLGLTHIPVGAGNTERLMTAVRQLRPDAIALTPSYALYLSEWAAHRGIDIAGSSVTRLLVAGEPGGGEARMRARLESAWGAKVTEAMGIGDIAVSLFGECEVRNGMHFSGRGLVHMELIDPATGEAIALKDGASGELVLTHLKREAAPMLRFRTRDHVHVGTGNCACGRSSPRIRCVGRTDDKLVVRGVNVFPSAIRQIVGEFAPAVTGVMLVEPKVAGTTQPAPLPVAVEFAEGAPGERAALAERIARRIREKLLVATEIRLAPANSLPRSDYKSKLVDFSKAAN